MRCSVGCWNDDCVYAAHPAMSDNDVERVMRDIAGCVAPFVLTDADRRHLLKSLVVRLRVSDEEVVALASDMLEARSATGNG